MGNQRPDITDEDIGMRTFQVRKAKMAERAAERLRHGLGSDWAQLSSDDVDELEWAFGELWAYIKRDEWEELHFGSLSMTDVWKILALGRDMRKHTRSAVNALTEIGAIIAARG